MIEPNPKYGGLRMQPIDIGLNENGLSLEDVAYHEGGHSVAAVVFELVLIGASVMVYKEDSKVTVRGETDWSPRESVIIPDKQVAVLHTGLLAATKGRYPTVALEYLPHFFTPSLKSGAADDLARADLVRQYYEDLDLFDERAFKEDLRIIIEDYWPAIVEVAQRLQETQTISGDDTERSSRPFGSTNTFDTSNEGSLSRKRFDKLHFLDILKSNRT